MISKSSSSSIFPIAGVPSKKLAEIIKDSLDEKYSENVFESSKEN